MRAYVTGVRYNCSCLTFHCREFDLGDVASRVFRSQCVGMAGVRAALGGGSCVDGRAFLCISLQRCDGSPAAVCDGGERVRLAEAQRATGGSAGGREQHAVSIRPRHLARH